MFEEEEKNTFDWLECSVCAIMIVASAAVGIYYAFFSKQNTVSEYLLGGKKMGTFPIAMSLIASHISCICLLGVPVEIYTYGVHVLLGVSSSVIGLVIIVYGFIPVFYNLQLISVNEYLELRFSKRVRLMASLLFGIGSVFFIPIVIYTVSLAFEEVSGVNVFIIAPFVSLICIFYTTVGGLKAVVWTDTLQAIVTILTVIVITVLGTVKAGGFLKVLEVNKEGGMFDLNLTPSPFQRITVWTITFGNIFSQVAFFGTHAGSVQRFASLPTLGRAKWSVIYMNIATNLIFFVCGYVGFVLYAIYHDCNPLTAKRIKRMDQLMPYFMMNFYGSFRGLPGLFIAGVFSGALGSMSAGLNTLAGLIYEDFLTFYLPKNISERKASNIVKITAATVGASCVTLVFFVDKLKGLVQMTMSFTGLSTGASLGMFLLGMFFPSANKKGALYGGITSLAFMSWIVFGNEIEQMRGVLVPKTVPTSIDNCPYNVSFTEPVVRAPTRTQVFILFRLSFTLYTMVGSLIVVIVGLIVSHFTGPCKPKDVNPALISPLVRKFYYKPEEILDDKEIYVISTSTKTRTSRLRPVTKA